MWCVCLSLRGLQTSLLSEVMLVRLSQRTDAAAAHSTQSTSPLPSWLVGVVGCPTYPNWLPFKTIQIWLQTGLYK